VVVACRGSSVELRGSLYGGWFLFGVLEGSWSICATHPCIILVPPASWVGLMAISHMCKCHCFNVTEHSAGSSTSLQPTSCHFIPPGLMCSVEVSVIFFSHILTYWRKPAMPYFAFVQVTPRSLSLSCLTSLGGFFNTAHSTYGREANPRSHPFLRSCWDVVGVLWCSFMDFPCFQPLFSGLVRYVTCQIVPLFVFNRQMSTSPLFLSWAVFYRVKWSCLWAAYVAVCAYWLLCQSHN